MVRTKKHFRPPSPAGSSSSSSSSEEEPEPLAQRGRGKQLAGVPIFGRGKQRSMGAPAAPAGARGKQLRAPPPPASDDESSDDSSSEEEEIAPPPVSRGKQLRPVGRGKQLRAPPPPTQESESEESDSSDDEEEATATATAVARGQGGGKGFARGGGKMLTRPAEAAEDDSSSSSSEEEPWAAPPRGRGKQLRPPPAPAAAKEDSDMEESSSSSSSSEEDEPHRAPLPEKKAPAKTPVESSSSSSESEVPTPKRRPTRAAAARAARFTRSTARREVSSAESDDDDGETEWGAETFDMRRLVTDGDDQKYLDSLTELERENILAERFEKRKQEADMQKALRENKRRERERREAAAPKKAPAKKRAPAKAKKAAAAKKRKIAKKAMESEDDAASDKDDTTGDAALAQDLAGRRVSGRNLAKKGKQFKKQAALAKIRKNRAQKQAVAEESDSDLDYGRDSDDSDDDYEEDTMVKPWQQKGRKAELAESSDDDRSEMEDDGRQLSSGGRRRTEDVEAKLEDYAKLSIPRRRLMRWCNEPFFERAVKEFYVRLGIGRDNKTQKACYRLCRITAIVAKSEYSFPRLDSQKLVSTNKWLQLSFGKFVREFKMNTVSEHRPSEEDVAQLVSQLKTERLSDHVLTKKTAAKLRKQQDELVNNYTYTKEDIDMLVKDKKKRNHKSLNIGMENSRIDISVQAAQDEVQETKKRLEDAKVEQMEVDDDMADAAESSVKKSQEALRTAQRKLEGKMEEQRKIQQEDRERIERLKKSANVQNWVKVNQRARLANQNADFQSYKEQQERGRAEPKFDPYARRRQQPKNLWEVGGGQAAAAVDKAAEGAGKEEKKETAPSERDDANAGKDREGGNHRREELPRPPQPDLPATNRFAFDDDILVGGDAANLGGTKKNPVQTRARKGISLDEYHERKTAGAL